MNETMGMTIPPGSFGPRGVIQIIETTGAGNIAIALGAANAHQTQTWSKIGHCVTEPQEAIAFALGLLREAAPDMHAVLVPKAESAPRTVHVVAAPLTAIQKAMLKYAADYMSGFARTDGVFLARELDCSMTELRMQTDSLHDGLIVLTETT